MKKAENIQGNLLINIEDSLYKTYYQLIFFI